MKRFLLSLTVVAVTLAAVTARAEVSGEQIQALEARIAQLERDNAEDAAKMTRDAGVREHLKINGFMSAGFGRVYARDFTYDGLSDEWSHAADSVIGLQFDGQVNDKTHAVVQLVGRGESSFAVDAEWAYIGYHATGRDELRVGRQRFPFFMASEYLEVGYSYPWVRPPAEVYLPFMPSSYDGVSWQHVMDTGNWTHTLQAYWGSEEFDVSGGTFELDDVVGAGWLSAIGDWQFSATYSRAKSTFSNDFFDALAAGGAVTPIDQNVGWYGGLGLQYDNGRLLVMTEATQVNVHGYFADSAEEYVTVGYRFGKWMPHLTYGSSRVTDPDQRPANALIPALCAGPGTLCLDAAGTVPFPADTLALALNTTQESVTAGMRYDFLPNANLKVDWTHVLDTHNTFGDFTRTDLSVFYGARPGNDINAYRVVIDVVF